MNLSKKNFLLFIFVNILGCISFSSWGNVIPWSDLEETGVYQSLIDIPVPLPNGSSVIFSAGKVMTLSEVATLPIPRYPLVQYQFLLWNCTSEENLMESDVFLFGKNENLGMKLSAECILEVYVEPQDLITQSFLRNF